MDLKPTTKVAEALALAQRAAQTHGNPEITPDHITSALIQLDTPRPICSSRLRAPAPATSWLRPTPASARSRASPAPPTARPSGVRQPTCSSAPTP